MLVNCIVCSNCKELIYSRARHDMNWCSCGTIAIDGGRNYTKISFKKVFAKIYALKLSDSITEFDLVDDWNQERPEKGLIGNYGRLKENEYMWNENELYYETISMIME